MLPVQPSWEPLDLASFNTLRLTVLIPTEPNSDITLQLISVDDEDVERISSPISLIARGLKRGQPTKLSVSLREFSEKAGFELRRTRSVMIEGYFCSRMELAQVYLCGNDDSSISSGSRIILLRKIRDYLPSLKMSCSGLTTSVKRAFTLKKRLFPENTNKD